MHTTLTAKMNLASLLSDLGQRDKARAMYEEVVAGHTQALGEGHTDTLRARNALACMEG